MAKMLIKFVCGHMQSYWLEQQQQKTRFEAPIAAEKEEIAELEKRKWIMMDVFLMMPRIYSKLTRHIKKQENVIHSIRKHNP
jgi:CRISPR/Cas system-associated protein endoribonuclease Cas2